MNKFKFILILIILSSIVNYSAAQNLVPNPSFETYSSCPNNFSQLNKAIPWYDPTSGSSDYYNSCDTGYMNVPFCGTGYQWSKNGLGHVGLWALNGFGDYSREYIQVHLISPLIVDSCYLVEFYCNLDNHTSYSINKLGVYLSNIPVNNTGGTSVLQYNPQIVSSYFLTDTTNWMYVFGYYHALGGEQYITLGDFKLFEGGDTLRIGQSSYPGAYYFIDDVSVTKISACDTTSTSIHEQADKSPFDLFPNPNNGNMTLKYSINANDIAFIQITDITGKQIARYSVPASTNAVQINNEQLENGIYIYHIIVNNKPVKSDKLLIIK